MSHIFILIDQVFRSYTRKQKVIVCP